MEDTSIYEFWSVMTGDIKIVAKTIRRESKGTKGNVDKKKLRWNDEVLKLIQYLDMNE